MADNPTQTQAPVTAVSAEPAPAAATEPTAPQTFDLQLPDGRSITVGAQQLLDYATFGAVEFDRQQSAKENPVNEAPPQNLTAEQKAEQRIAALEAKLAEREEHDKTTTLAQQLAYQSTRHELTKNDPDLAKVAEVMASSFMNLNPKLQPDKIYPAIVKVIGDTIEKAVAKRQAPNSQSANDKLRSILNRNVAPNAGAGTPATGVAKITPKDVQTGGARKHMESFLKTMNLENK